MLHIRVVQCLCTQCEGELLHLYEVCLPVIKCFQIGAGLYAVGRPVWKRNDEDGQIGTIQSLPLERGALFSLFFGEPAHGPPHVAGGASGPIGGCRDESRTDNPDLEVPLVVIRVVVIVPTGVGGT